MLRAGPFQLLVDFEVRIDSRVGYSVASVASFGYYRPGESIDG